MKNIEQIDPNFKPAKITAEDVEFYDCRSEFFELHGFYKPYKSERFSRLPADFATGDEVNEGVRQLMFNTAGGRVRFVTDSPYIAIAADVDGEGAMQHLTGICQFGFDMYAADINDRNNPIYKISFFPTLDSSSKNSTYDGFFEFDDIKMREITINFPMYTNVNKLMIGLKEGCTVKKPEPYSISKPVVFYGSSISQGGCATRPGNVYTALLSRWLDADHINLGFSGSDRGETALAKHIANLEMSAFVYAYGHNAPSIEHYRNTHYPFYKIVRDKNPLLPIIIMSPPICPQIRTAYIIERHTLRRSIAMSTYLKALEEGDRNVYFVDGFSVMPNTEPQECTVDGCHPNDHGFYSIAKALYPVLETVLKNL